MHKKTILQRAIILMIAAQIVAVACGDGGKKRRAPINRSGANGQKSTPQAKTQPGNTPSNSSASAAKGQGNGDLPSQEDVAKKTATLRRIDEEVQKRVGNEGTGVIAQELEEGVYNLDEVLSRYDYQESSEHVVALNVYQNNNNVLSPTVGEAAVPTANYKYIDQGRDFVIPIQFSVQGESGQPWQPLGSKTNPVEMLFHTKFEVTGRSTSLKDGFQGGSDVRTDTVSLLEAINGPSVTLDTLDKKETGYETLTNQDKENKKVQVRLRKGTDGKLRIFVTVLEEGQEGGVTDSQRVMKRTLVFLYSRKPLTTPATPMTVEKT
jgi:hypothetical protein